MWDYQKDYVESELRNLTNTVISDKTQGLGNPHRPLAKNGDTSTCVVQNDKY